MENRTICLESTDDVRLNSLGDENFVMAIEGQNFVFSFDAMYDLAVRMTMLIQNAENAQDQAEASVECCSAVSERAIH